MELMTGLRDYRLLMARVEILRMRGKHDEVEGLEGFLQGIAKGLEALPDEQRLIIVAHDIDGRTMTDIARELYLSTQTAHRRRQAGLESLRQIIA